ncbi:MAG: hypothetical protein ACLFQX_13365, partial [Candidatus Kapaibacterium sp.]
LDRIPDHLENFSLRVTHPDYNNYQSSVGDVPRSGDDRKLDITLTSRNEPQDTCCGVIKVIAVRGESTQRLGGVEVRLNQGKSIIATSTTNNDGVAWFDRVCFGEYWLRLAKDSYNVIEENIAINDCDTLVMDYRMSEKSNPEDSCCHGKIIIDVKESGSGERISGVKVRLWKDGHKIETQQTSNGRVVFDGLCEGEYGIDLLSENYTNIEFVVDLECNETIEIVKEIESEDCCQGRIYIIPKDSQTGERIHNATVNLWKGSTKLRTQNTGDNGMTVFEALCEGEYGISILHEEYQNIEFVVELGCNETKELVREMAAVQPDTCCTARLKIIAKDAETEATISGARVEIYRGDDMIADGATNADGIFLKEGLCAPEEYSIRVLKEGYSALTYTFKFNECKTIQEHYWLQRE